MSLNYTIDGTTNLNHNDTHKLPIYTQFQKHFEQFKQLLLSLVEERKSATFIHFGDGDYFFLKKMAVGSATPGKRALSIPYNLFNIIPYKEGWLKNDYHCVEYLEKGLPEKLNELYPGIKTIATEFLYGLTMNKWFFKTFKGKIGIIGASEKIELIQKLMNYVEYQEYLGVDKFNDYIKVPQKFACDDLENTINVVKEQLERADNNTAVYLFGVGHVKSGLIHHLPKIKQALYIDIGACIDGIAGLIDPERPYAGSWINHRLENNCYSGIDLLNYNLMNDKNVKYLC